MGSRFSALDEKHITFIGDQRLFFVATAARDGRVNVSPKGLDSLRVLGPNRVVWLNLTGSGNETAAHLLDVNRMTLMFCAFQGAPLILRLYGTAVMIQPGDADWAERVALFGENVGARQLFDMTIDLVQTSCGYGVPLFDHQGDRDQLTRWATSKGPDGVADYQQQKNLVSLDGRPTGLVPR